jgi:hypothetical protein
VSLLIFPVMVVQEDVFRSVMGLCQVVGVLSIILLDFVQLRLIVRVVVLSGIFEILLVTFNCAENFVFSERLRCDVVPMIVVVIKLVMGLVLSYGVPSVMMLLFAVKNWLVMMNERLFVAHKFVTHNGLTLLVMHNRLVMDK